MDLISRLCSGCWPVLTIQRQKALPIKKSIKAFLKNFPAFDLKFLKLKGQLWIFDNSNNILESDRKFFQVYIYQLILMSMVTFCFYGLISCMTSVCVILVCEVWSTYYNSFTTLGRGKSDFCANLAVKVWRGFVCRLAVWFKKNSLILKVYLTATLLRVFFWLMI